MSELEQCATIELTVRQQRQLVEQYKDAWRHVLRQALAQRLAQALTRQRARIRHHVRFESLGLCSRQHDAGAHAWMQTDRSLDFRRLDPEPAHLHLLVRAPHPPRTPALHLPPIARGHRFGKVARRALLRVRPVRTALLLTPAVPDNRAPVPRRQRTTRPPLRSAPVAVARRPHRRAGSRSVVRSASPRARTRSPNSSRRSPSPLVHTSYVSARAAAPLLVAFDHQ